MEKIIRNTKKLVKDILNTNIVDKNKMSAGNNNMKDILNIEEFRHFAFPLTNNCNLSCDCCSVHADIPIDKDSIYPERRELYRMKPSEIEKIIDKLDGMGRNDWHRLTGGEPTLYLDDCLEAIEILSNDNRKICLATNGIHLLDITPTILNKIGWIELDYHHTNQDVISKCKRYLKNKYDNYLRVIQYGRHYDLHYARFHPSNNIYCGYVMRVIKFRDNLIYPCGHFECLTAFRHDTNIQDLLIEHDWTLDNPDLPFLLKHWRETIPLDIFKYCMSCWRPNYKTKKLPKMKK